MFLTFATCCLGACVCPSRGIDAVSRRSSLLRALHAAGILLAIIGVTFVVHRILNQSAQIDFSRLDSMMWLAIGLLATGYGLANGLLAVAWWNLLQACGLLKSRRWAARVYGIAQIAKYVPGNITHLLGRQALGMAASLPGWLLAKTTVYEIGLMAVAGGFFGVLVLPLVGIGFAEPISIVLFLGLFAAGVGFFWRVLGRQWAWAFALQVLFLGTSGLVFLFLLGLLAGDFGNLEASAAAVVGAYVLAWLAGLLTPGAPAGIGIRETVLLLLLASIFNETDLLLAIVLGRLVTVGGDFGFFVWAFLSRDSAEANLC
jgi:glycosyltransferase 2 family protein